MANGLQDIGRVFEGLSAGLQGRLPELQQQRRLSQQQTIENERQARLDKIAADNERRKTVFTDSAIALQLAESGDFAGAAAVGQSRLDVARNFPDADLSQTQQLTQMAQAAANGDTASQTELIRSLRNNVKAGQAIGVLTAPKAGEAFTLKPEEVRFGPRGEEIARGRAVAPKEIPRGPSKLLAGLSSSTRAKAKEAFELAGGGKDGIKAMNAQIALSQTQAQREDIPRLLDQSFPNASPAERLQLDAAVQGAKTVESGLKIADRIRTEQRRLKKAADFQERAVSLLDGILASDQLGDVTGSIEGGIDIRLTDVESEVIADITEAQNILTAKNMDLMTGVLSESDIKLLKNLSAGALNRLRGEKRFRKDAQTLRDKLASELVQPVGGAQPAGAVTAPTAGRTIEVDF